MPIAIKCKCKKCAKEYYCPDLRFAWHNTDFCVECMEDILNIKMKNGLGLGIEIKQETIKEAIKEYLNKEKDA